MGETMKIGYAKSDVEKQVKKVIEYFQYDKDMLIQILLKSQDNFGWLPREVLIEVSKRLDVSLSRVYKIASFYNYFRLMPKGKHIVKVCMGTACKSRGSTPILDESKSILGIEPGETTPDLEYSLETVNCLGCCAIGPVMVLDGMYHGHLHASDVKKLLKYEKGG